eukprot:452579_1
MAEHSFKITNCQLKRVLICLSLTCIVFYVTFITQTSNNWTTQSIVWEPFANGTNEIVPNTYTKFNLNHLQQQLNGVIDNLKQEQHKTDNIQNAIDKLQTQLKDKNNHIENQLPPYFFSTTRGSYTLACVPPYVCQDENHLKGITFSLFSTIAAIKKLNEDGKYEIQYSLIFGTLLALKRNSKIFAWDTDADCVIYIKFNHENMYPSDDELDVFKQDLKTAIDTILGNMNEINDSNLWWNTDGYDGYHTLHIEVLKYSLGYLDVFILSLNHDETQVRNLHCCVGILRKWQPKQLLFPIKKQFWGIYNITVHTPNKDTEYLEQEYGENYMIPEIINNISVSKMGCKNINDTVIYEWMQHFKPVL